MCGSQCYFLYFYYLYQLLDFLVCSCDVAAVDRVLLPAISVPLGQLDERISW
jgi:hypothetical protein